MVEEKSSFEMDNYDLQTSGAGRRYYIKDIKYSFIPSILAIILLITSSVLYIKETAKPKEIEYTLKNTYYDAVDYFSSSSNKVTTYKFLEKYVGIIEPKAPMELHIYDTSMLDGSTAFEWTICKNFGDKSCLTTERTDFESSNTLSFHCDPYDTFRLEVTRYDVETFEVLSSFEGEVVCLYIRREIRTLTQDHIDQYLDAHYTLTNTSHDTGVEKYGTGFYSAKKLAEIHLYNAGQRSSDHLHDGNGFVTQHVKLQVLFEAAIHAVDKYAYLPYWDFTQDEKAGYESYDSPIFTDWYGGVNMPKVVAHGYQYTEDLIETARITSGRWANLTAETNELGEALPSGYGYLRAPWVMNPSPYVSRYASDYLKFPACGAHYLSLSTDYESMMDYFVDVSGLAHGPTHIIIGGKYGCDSFQQMQEGGYISVTADVNDICQLALIQFPIWYRSGYWWPNENCAVNSTDLRDSACGYSCDDRYKVDLVASFFDTAGEFLVGLADDIIVMEAWYGFFCNANNTGREIFAGESFEASSASDPIFWAIHPAIERLVQAKLMLGGFDNEQWNTNPEEEYICDFQYCYDMTSETWGYFDYCCYGHYENDQLEFYDTSTGEVSDIGMTNAEVVAAFDPRSENYSMPYIYDHFRWDHCDEDFPFLFV